MISLAVIGLNMLFTLVIIIVGVAYFTLFERKILAGTQIRVGPFNVGLIGTVQPLADALKLLIKTNSLGTEATLGRSVLIMISPVIFIALAGISWAVYPCVWVLHDCQTLAVYILVVLGLTVYGVVIIGWVSKSNYAVVGALRAVSQSISYEVVLILSVTLVLWCLGTADLFVVWVFSSLCPFALAMIVSCVMSFVSLLAETGRAPFDLQEGESEIVAGWNIELSGGQFTAAFLSEQIWVVWSSMLLSSFFLGISLLSIKIVLILWVNVIVRSAYPRMRFDNVIGLCWTQLLPLLLSTACVIIILI